MGDPFGVIPMDMDRIGIGSGVRRVPTNAYGVIAINLLADVPADPDNRSRREVIMTDDKKHEDKDRKKVSDEELEDVAGGQKIEGQIGKAAKDLPGIECKVPPRSAKKKPGSSMDAVTTDPWDK